MNNDNKKTFIGLIKECNRICIPEIQRDYAQGRDNEKVNEIRKRFVHILMRVVKGQEPEQELDFVYGSNHVIASDNDDPILQFEPLDGQQRLTTLFLLHWMMGCGDLISSDSFHSVGTVTSNSDSISLPSSVSEPQTVTNIRIAQIVDDECRES